MSDNKVPSRLPRVVENYYREWTGREYHYAPGTAEAIFCIRHLRCLFASSPQREDADVALERLQSHILRMDWLAEKRGLSDQLQTD